MVELIQKLEEFRVAMLWIGRVAKDIDHVAGDVSDRLLLSVFLLCIFFFLDVLGLHWTKERS